MKKSILFLLILWGAGAPAFSQTLFPGLESDFSRVMLLLGQEILPTIQQNDLSGSGIGQATLGNSHFFIGLTVGSVVSDGLLKFRNETDWQTLDLSGLINTIVPASGPARSLYDASANAFPYPTLKVNAGVALPWGFELLGSGMYLPQAFTSPIISGLASNLNGLSVSAANYVFRLRHPLILEQGNFPAVSLGVGYSYSQVSISYQLSNFQQSIAGQTVAINGALNSSTQVNSFGTDLTISKNWLIFTPFLTTSLWYEAANYNSSANLTATVVSTSSSSSLSPSASTSLGTIAPIFTGGFDINLYVMRLLLSGSYNLGTKFWGADLSTRLQF
ncbi:MAG: hypothetical protein HKM06_06825 [Spirochaetales bacterium]|nr:hypothetical protein [Spirochaetales bacterium]